MRGETAEGTPCRHGHGTTRYVKSGMCVTCHRLYMAAYNERRRQEAAARRNPALKPLTVKTGHVRRHDALVRPAAAPEKRETVDEFLARGGRIQRVPVGATGLRV